MYLAIYFFFFFFQAEDGIRDDLVTGVQTCALPIWSPGLRFAAVLGCVGKAVRRRELDDACEIRGRHSLEYLDGGGLERRSEERRVGKECRYRWAGEY